MKYSYSLTEEHISQIKTGYRPELMLHNHYFSGIQSVILNIFHLFNNLQHLCPCEAPLYSICDPEQFQ